MQSKQNQDRLIRVGFVKTWSDLKPALQHTLAADVILGNVFEPLLRTTNRGVLRSAGAKAWSVSPDMRVFTFTIDRSKKFSNGAYLTAHHYKKSWEEGLALAPKSANSSLADVLYKIEGAERFQDTRTLPGVVVKDESTLELRFSSPFRMGLEQLAGIRYSAVLRDGVHEFGTGPYVIARSSENEVDLVMNPHSAIKPSFSFHLFKVNH